MTIPKRKQDAHKWLAKTPSDTRVEIRLPAELLDAAQSYADERGLTLSRAIRYMIVTGIAAR